MNQGTLYSKGAYMVKFQPLLAILLLQIRFFMTDIRVIQCLHTGQQVSSKFMVAFLTTLNSYLSSHSISHNIKNFNSWNSLLSSRFQRMSHTLTTNFGLFSAWLVMLPPFLPAGVWHVRWLWTWMLISYFSLFS